ncbi:MAG: HD domain-containing protein [Ruminococcaceae bacterium]|nr:HD domain-containing protein [Oscillospiraceae bacterium]
MAEQPINKCVKDFKANDFVVGYFYIRISEMKQTATNSRYMNFTLSDKTGDINAKLWDGDEDNAKRYPAGIIVKAQGHIVEWQGQIQFKIERIRKTISDDNVSIEDFVPSAPVSAESMLSYVENVASNIEDVDYQAIVLTLIDVYREKLLFFPAAKSNHHAVRGGLLYHVSTMLKAAEALISVYNDFLNKDLLYAGVILHDIGKIEEMTTGDSGLVEEYSVAGTLLGHISQGMMIIGKYAEMLNINKEKALMLQHMILSHHYLPEYGSPKYPHFPEAELLHYLDILDARMYDMKKIVQGLEPGTFSERQRSLDNRAIYKPLYENGEDFAE